MKSQMTICGTAMCFMLLLFDCDVGHEPLMPMHMTEMGPPSHTGFGSIDLGKMMHLAGGPPGAELHPQMMQPQQQQQPVGHCMAGHMMNSSEVMRDQSLPRDQILPWFDSDM